MMFIASIFVVIGSFIVSYIYIRHSNNDLKVVEVPNFLFVKTINQSVTDRICLIGAGIGGASAAYYLRKSFQNIDLVLFEAEDTAGGRANSFIYNNTVIEAGASIIHGSNLMFKHFAVDLLNLTAIPNQKRSFAIYDGDHFVFESFENGILTSILILINYGIDLLKLSSSVSDLLSKFNSVYLLLHDNAKGFVDSSQLWNAVGLLDLTNIPLESYLKKHLHIGNKFITELSDSINRVNYGQSSSMLNALAGMVSLSTTSSGSKLWKVKEGNQKVVEGLFRISQVTQYFNDPVSSITKSIHNGDSKVKWILQSKHQESFACDYVVVSTPLMTTTASDAGMKYPLQFSSNINDIPSNLYQSTHATFVKGKLNAAFFKKTSLPQAIYTTQINNHRETFFTSVALQANTTDLFKVFSPQSLTALQLETLFEGVPLVIARYPWKAYPKYAPPDGIVPFVLDAAGLYYVNGLEMGASALEVSAIAGKNVANLIVEEIANR